MDPNWQPRRSLRSILIPLLIGLSASLRNRVEMQAEIAALKLGGLSISLAEAW